MKLKNYLNEALKMYSMAFLENILDIMFEFVDNQNKEKPLALRINTFKSKFNTYLSKYNIILSSEKADTWLTDLKDYKDPIYKKAGIISGITNIDDGSIKIFIEPNRFYNAFLNIEKRDYAEAGLKKIIEHELTHRAYLKKNRNKKINYTNSKDSSVQYLSSETELESQAKNIVHDIQNYLEIENEENISPKEAMKQAREKALKMLETEQGLNSLADYSITLTNYITAFEYKSEVIQKLLNNLRILMK